MGMNTSNQNAQTLLEFRTYLALLQTLDDPKRLVMPEIHDLISRCKEPIQALEAKFGKE